MLPASHTAAELQVQRTKLANSYAELLKEFSSKDLQSVGNYNVGRLIGKGSFGKAYLASHKLINGSKVVLKSANKDDSNLAREIHHHRQFLHPHIARLYEVIVTESLVWLVLEYCPGNELYHYLLKNGPLPPATVQKIFTQLAGAVAYIHQKSCVHRDLKLENILLDKNEDVKLCDFGFTREYEGKSNYLQTWCGTVCYAAPEMLKGEKYAAEKVDVWSLGIILYALLCGELPFDEDNETATKAKILKEEPVYPEHIPAAAKNLLVSLLSKRPLLRPSLADILTNQWFSDWAPQQQSILKVQQPAPFTTQLETDTLQRMRSAGVNIDAVIENVLSQRCDTLAGWWALLLEKEERKEKRRQRKRRQKEAELKSSRRISTASGHVLSATIKESDEEKGQAVDGAANERGRSPSRVGANASLPATPTLTTPIAEVPPFVLKTSEAPQHNETGTSRPTSSSKRISQLGPGVDQKKRGGMLQVVTTDSAMLTAEGTHQKRKRRYQPQLLAHFAHLKHWLKDSTRRVKPLQEKVGTRNVASERPQDLYRGSSDPSAQRVSTQGLRPELVARNPHGPIQLSTHVSIGSNNRHSSHSPSPITPKSTNRRSTTSNLRGRKSTSSSVSSVRSMHVQHRHSHSKASSVSSASVGSPSNISAKSINAARRRSSPHSTVRAVAVPITNPSSNSPRVMPRSHPPHLNLQAQSPQGQASPFSGLGPPSPGLMFTKRKRSVFKGPATGGTRRRSDGTGIGVVAGYGDGVSEAEAVQTRRSGEVTITEEDEEQNEVEEVEAFLPVEEGERAYIVEEEEEEEEEKEEAHAAAGSSRGVVDNGSEPMSSGQQPHTLTKWELDA